MSIRIDCEGGELYAVPAIHYNHYFASEVRMLCLDPETRPDAVAVELGPHAAAAVEQWIRKLTAGTPGNRNMPAMLGLLKRNRMIKASLRKKAVSLQKRLRKDLSELPPKMLREDLGLSDHLLLCLTPTDSIIEGIRTAVELNMPVFGVDLDEMADGLYKQVMIQSPAFGQDLRSYVAQNAGLAERQRDAEVDHRREVAMAARLKMLLRRHKRVLFTCGMAHWLKIRKLLTDATISASRETAIMPGRVEGFRRVVVDPRIAAGYMDLFPALAGEYEEFWLRTGRPSVSPVPLCRTPETIFRDCLKKVYRRYFTDQDRSEGRAVDLEKTRDFERYLSNMTFLNCHEVPNLHSTIRAAREMMSDEFTGEIAKELMSFPWARPDQFPDCAVLRPSSDEKDSQTLELLTKGETEKKEQVCIRVFPSNTHMAPLPDVGDERKEAGVSEEYVGFGPHLCTWPPWDRLISSLSVRAIGRAKRKYAAKTSVSFEGSVLEGIDVKSTIRAYARGKDRLYVRDRSPERPIRSRIESFPVVWIMDVTEQGDNDWIVLVAPCRYMEEHIKDKDRFYRVINERGQNMVSTIAYGGPRSRVEPVSEKVEIKTDRYQGVTVFQPVSFINRQFAYWAESTGYNRSPFCNGGLPAKGMPIDVSEYYEKTHNLGIGKFQWSTVLILLALPYARGILTVVVPDGYRIEKEAHRRARNLDVEICPVPLRSFTPAELDRLSICHLVSTINEAGECDYSAEIERILGERWSDNRHLMPQSLLDYGMRYER